MKYLIFFDNTGNIYFSMTVDEAPQGLERFTFDLPEGAQLEKMDMTDPNNPVPVYTEYKEGYNIDKASEDITTLQTAIADIYDMLGNML